MSDTLRTFEVGPDPFGRSWQVSFVWQQNAISIRHADTVDVKFRLSDGETTDEKVIAIPHPLLLELASKLGRPLNDAWCLKLAALHLRALLLTGEDTEKALVTMNIADMEAANRVLEASRASSAA